MRGTPPRYADATTQISRVDQVVVDGLAVRPWPKAPARHEAAHGVAATLLGIPFRSILSRADGSGTCDLALTTGGTSTTPTAMVARMAVVAAGVVGEAEYSDPLALFSGSQFGTDRATLAAIRRMFDEMHPGMQYRDPIQLARVVLLAHESWRAVDLVARALEANGTLTAEAVAGLTATAYRRAGVPAVFPRPEFVGFCEPWAPAPAKADPAPADADEVIDLVLAPAPTH